eukprot:755259-Hanusia_phi.AAC.2
MEGLKGDAEKRAESNPRRAQPQRDYPRGSQGKPDGIEQEKSLLSEHQEYYLGIAATVHGGFPSSCSVVLLTRAEERKLSKKFDRVHKQVTELDIASAAKSCRENASIYYKYYAG